MKIAGPGLLRIGRDGLEIDAYQADAKARIEAALVVVLLAVVAVAVMLSAEPLFLKLPSLFVHMAGGALGGLFYFAVIAGRDKHLADRPVQMVIPWASIGKASLDLRHPGGVVVVVKGESARETLHFHPACGTDELLCAMRERPLIG